MERNGKFRVDCMAVLAVAFVALAGTQAAASQLEVPAAQRTYLLPAAGSDVLEVPAAQRVYALPVAGNGMLEVPAAQRAYSLPAADSGMLEVPAGQRIHALGGVRSNVLEAPASQRVHLVPSGGIQSGMLEVAPQQRAFAIPATQTSASTAGIRGTGIYGSFAAAVILFTFAGMIIGWAVGRRSGGVARRPSHAIGR